MTGLEYLQLVGWLRSIPQTVLGSRAERLLDLFLLYGHRYSPISSYSNGIKQKVLISAALMHDPETLIFDEPLSGLEVTSVLPLRSVVHTLAQEGTSRFWPARVNLTHCSNLKQLFFVTAFCSRQ